MLARLRAHLKYSNVAATAAVIVALGGGAYAATQVGTGQIKNNAVTGAKIAKNAVTSPKVKNGSLVIADLKGVNASGGIRGPVGAKGLTGDQGSQGRVGNKGPTGDPGPGGLPGVQGVAGAAGKARAYAIVDVKSDASGTPQLDPARLQGFQAVTRPALGSYCVQLLAGVADPAQVGVGPAIVSPDMAISTVSTGKIVTYVDHGTPLCATTPTSYEVDTFVDGAPSNGVGFDLLVP